MEILGEKSYGEFETFAKAHPQSCFMQSVNWAKVKDNWKSDVVVSRDGQGNIVGGIFVLVQTFPVFGTSFLYAPRGPVCDLKDRAVLADLTEGVKALGKKHRAHSFKCDPDVYAEDGDFIRMMEDLGFTYYKGGLNFHDTIQPRFNYRLYVNGRTEEELFANLTQKTRYNVRVAMKKGVEVRPRGVEGLDDFYPLMQVTGDRDGFSIRPKSYFEKFLEAYGENVRLYIAYYEGKPVSGAITTVYGNKACYVYGASDNNYRNVMPNYLMQWEMIRWAVAEGVELYDFLGISGDMDESNPLYGLYRFKRGFNGEIAELAGEFNMDFKPLVNKAVNTATDLAIKLRKMKGKVSAT